MRNLFTIVFVFILSCASSLAAAQDRFLVAKQLFQTMRLMANAGAPENATILSEGLKAQFKTLSYMIRLIEFAESPGLRDEHAQALLKLGRMHLNKTEVRFLTAHYDDFLRHWLRTDPLFRQAFKDHHATWSERTKDGFRWSLKNSSVIALELLFTLVSFGHYNPSGLSDEPEMRDARQEVRVALGLRVLLQELYRDCDDALTTP